MHVVLLLNRLINVLRLFCSETLEMRPALIFGRVSSFWQYKICADIRSDSLERRR